MTAYNYEDVKAVLALCPFLPDLARTVNADPALVALFVRAETELQKR